MNPTTIREEITDRLDRLGPVDRRRVLKFIRCLPGTLPVGTPGADLRKFIGAIPHEDLELMRRTIEESCEQVGLNGR